MMYYATVSARAILPAAMQLARAQENKKSGMNIRHYTGQGEKTYKDF